MFKKHKPRQLDPRVKYQQREFKGKLAKARGYQRPAGGSVAALLRKLNWKLLLGTVFLLGLAWYISFVPNFLFVRSVVVSGGSDVVSAEVRAQVLHYIEGKNFVFPKENLLFVSKRDVTSYLTTANVHVWKVTEVQKKWPHDLVVTIVPREPAFVWNANGQQIILANDGSVLPLGEVKDISALLPISGQLSASTAVGSPVLTDKLLSSLTVLKNDFSTTTGLPKLSGVELVPVLAESFGVVPPAAQVGQTAPAPVGQDLAATSATEPPKAPRVLDVPPRELRARVTADTARGMGEFALLLDVDDTNASTLNRLKELLAGQSVDRLAHLAYVDMRFDSRVYICLTTAPCAKEGATENSSTK